MLKFKKKITNYEHLIFTYIIIKNESYAHYAH